MTSREIVEITLYFKHPPRVARSFWESDVIQTRSTAKTSATRWKQIDTKRWERTDEWGNTWQRIDSSSKGEVTKGALENLDRINELSLPHFSNPKDYYKVKEARGQFPDKWLVGSMPGFTFNVARKLRKLEQYLADLLLEPEKTKRLHNRIDQTLCHMIENYAKAGVDSVMFPEDWGTQDRLMIHPNLWRHEFFPRFKKLCGVAHDCGIKVFMHSCGQIEAIVPDLIQAGIEVLQFDQPELHGLDVLAAHQDFSPITFWCPVDIQSTLQSHNEQIIRAKVREILDKIWHRKGGGFIAGFYNDHTSIDLQPQWQEIACDEFVRYGVSSDTLS